MNQIANISSGVNKLMNSVSTKLQTNWAWGLPRRILIEPTNACNLKCPLCPVGDESKDRITGLMKFDQFKKIVDEVKGKTREFDVAGYGEPTINKDLYKMLNYAVSSNIRILLHSNGILLDSPEKVEKLISSRIYQITVSIDGSTQEVYEKYRIGGNLEAALNNLQALVDEKKKQGVTHPIIEWRTVATRINEHQIEDMRAMADKIGVDKFHLKSVNLATISETNATKTISRSIADKFLPESVKLRRFGQDEERNVSNKCNWLYKNAYIMWNGDVTTCCYDTYNINVMGNLFEEGSLRAVWNNSKYRKLRQQVNTDISKAGKLCSCCPEHGFVYNDDEPQEEN